jgi:hypothetical protein
MPYIAPPPEIRKLDPAFAECDWYLSPGHDPPSVLEAATAMLVAPNKPKSHPATTTASTAGSDPTMFAPSPKPTIDSPGGQTTGTPNAQDDKTLGAKSTHSETAPKSTQGASTETSSRSVQSESLPGVSKAEPLDTTSHGLPKGAEEDAPEPSDRDEAFTTEQSTSPTGKETVASAETGKPLHVQETHSEAHTSVIPASVSPSGSTSEAAESNGKAGLPSASPIESDMPKPSASSTKNVLPTMSASSTSTVSNDDHKGTETGDSISNDFSNLPSGTAHVTDVNVGEMSMAVATDGVAVDDTTIRNGGFATLGSAVVSVASGGDRVVVDSSTVSLPDVRGSTIPTEQASVGSLASGTTAPKDGHDKSSNRANSFNPEQTAYLGPQGSTDDRTTFITVGSHSIEPVSDGVGVDGITIRPGQEAEVGTAQVSLASDADRLVVGTSTLSMTRSTATDVGAIIISIWQGTKTVTKDAPTQIVSSPTTTTTVMDDAKSVGSKYMPNLAIWSFGFMSMLYHWMP